MLTYLRKREGLSQQDLAYDLGVAKSTISMYENGQRKPSFEMLEVIADYFNVNMDTLIGSSKASVQTPDELNEYLEMLKTRPECRMLFSLAKDSSKEDVEKAVAIIEAIRRTEGR